MANSSKPLPKGASDIPQPQFQGVQPNTRQRVGNPKPLDPKVWKTPGQQALEIGLQQVFGHDPKGSKPSTVGSVVPSGKNTKR